MPAAATYQRSEVPPSSAARPVLTVRKNVLAAPRRAEIRSAISTASLYRSSSMARSLAAGAGREAVELARVTGQRKADLPMCAWVPQPDRVIPRAGRECLAVRAPGQSMHREADRPQIGDRPLLRHVEEPDGVGTRRSADGQ